MKLLFIAFLIVFLPIGLLAQTKPKTIAGTIKDTKNEWVIGATVKLLKASDSTLVKGEIANENGFFQFKNLQNGTYLLSVTAVAYKLYKSVHLIIDDNQTNIVLPVIILLPAKNTELKEVVVTAKRSLIEQDIDRTIVNVESMISAATSNTLEVLEKTPGIQVDNNGNISLNGRSGVLVLIDGRSTYMSGQDLAAYLKSLPGGMLDKIELIDNPPAKYEAAGVGVVNIRLKKNRSLGLTGNVSSSYSQGVTARTYQVINLNYNKKKLNWFGNIGYNTDANYVDDYYDRKLFTTERNLKSQVLLQNNFDYKSHGIATRAGLDYTLSPKTIIGFQVNLQTRPRQMRYDFESKSYDAALVLNAINTGISNSNFDWNTKGTNLNFQHKLNDKGRELSADLNYINYESVGNQQFKNFANANPTDAFRYDLRNDIAIYNLKADYVHPLKNKAMFEAGIKSSVVNNDNDSRYSDTKNNQMTSDFSKSNHFIYHENINSAYLNTRKSWKRLSVQAGLRLENTILKGNLLANEYVKESTFTQNFTNLFPTFFFNYKLDSLGKNSLGISFAKRINRPNYEQFNPFLVFRDKFSYTQGNPELHPQYMYRLELRYQYKQILTMGLSYNRAHDFVFQTVEAKDTIFITRPANIGQGRMFLLNTNIMLNPQKWWMMNVNLQTAYLTLKGIAYTETFDSSIPVYKINVNNQFTFSKEWSAELSGYYSSKDLNAQTTVQSRYRLLAAVQKKVLKNKGLLKFTFEDILHSWIQLENSFAIKQSTQYHRNESDTQRIGLAFSYRFGNETFARKRRHNDNAAEDEKGRVN